MPTLTVLAWLAAAAVVAFFVGMFRIRAVASPNIEERPHSRPGYHGTYLAILTALPAALLTLLWAGLEPIALRHLIAQDLPAAYQEMSTAQKSLITGQIDKVAGTLPMLSPEDRRKVEGARLGFSTMEEAQGVLTRSGAVLGSVPAPYIITAAVDQAKFAETSRLALLAVAGLFVAGGFFYGFTSIRPDLRARNLVEGVMKFALITASTLAVLTTFGIIFSVLFESIHFFQKVAPAEFFFGTVWDPRFSAAGSGGSEGQFGLLPILWGTLYISFVALLVAVPIGLFAAIYMSEYASNRFRGFAKPVIEILAGIPTIVYGFFALVTFGPLLRDLGASFDLTIAASSVLTAGIVMGIMIIPFVSSLSDDIISAVPQSLREGSLGLGATKSETIKKVVLPAALPGVVGAVLLAASRAIGETMIVVLAAGIAANLTLNPFESVTTMTVKIVSQLTGDLEFTSPQTLVAFALGLTLFVITLGLNVYALYIVRKYREQYD